ncbi:phosphoinositide 3-kinase adapter protein 1-like isoform X2 [Ptychodera flava]|uniref:phosphoinositide 3-kinase adapter protein 1-like isoform X2 n=1 Tax=Ptychodera flava TaxID=63121 RepID=UPI00396A8F27
MDLKTAVRRYHLSIMYVDDGGPWCEFLCEQFKSAYDIDLFWENIKDLPLPDSPARNVENSKAQMIIVTPGYIDVANPIIDDLLSNPIAFLCGVEEDSPEAEELQRKVESFKTWEAISATNDMRDIVSQTFMIIDGIADVDDQPNYVTINDEDEEDSGPEGQDTYMVMKETGLKQSSKPNDLVKQLEKNGMVIQPNKAVCGSPEMVLIIFKAANFTDQSSRYIVKFKGTREVDIDGIRLNDYALTVRLPQDLPSGEVTVSVFKAGSLSILGECKFEFQDQLDVIVNLLTEALNPKELLCQALQVSSGNIAELDAILTANYKKQTAINDMDRLSPIRHEVEAAATTRETPTLIHFAAKFGLEELTSLLVNSPGSLMAFEIVNCNGDYPNDIARNEGYHGLADFLENFVECGALMEDINSSMMLYREVYDQINPEGREEAEAGDDELYMVMTAGAPYYNIMHQFKHYKEGMYDMPFPVPISADLTGRLFAMPQDDPIYTINDDKLKEVIQEGTVETIYDDLPAPRLAKSSTAFEGYHPSFDDEEVYQNPDAILPLPFAPSSVTQRIPSHPRPERQRPGSLKDDHSQSPAEAATPSTMPAARPLGDGTHIAARAGPPAGISAAQLELINIQTQVKEGKLTIDEALKLFNEFKLDKQENFYSYQTQTEFIYAAKTSLKKKKEEIESLTAAATARPLPSPPEDQVEKKASWNNLHRKMTCKPGQHGKQGRGRAAPAPRPPSVEEEQPRNKPRGQMKGRRRKRHDPDAQVNQENRLSQHLNFAEDYMQKEIPPIPDRTRAGFTHIYDAKSGVRIVREPPPPPPEVPEEAEDTSLPPFSPPPVPSRVPSHPGFADGPLPPPPQSETEHEFDIEYDLQGALDPGFEPDLGTATHHKTRPPGPPMLAVNQELANMFKGNKPPIKEDSSPQLDTASQPTSVDQGDAMQPYQDVAFPTMTSSSRPDQFQQRPVRQKPDVKPQQQPKPQQQSKPQQQPKPQPRPRRPPRQPQY